MNSGTFYRTPREKAITPLEASELNDDLDRQEFDEMVLKLNEVLKRSYRSGASVTIDSDLLKATTGKVQQEVVQHFTNAGWDISFRGDQRDGDYYNFKAK